MSKKEKIDAPIEFEKDKRGLREIPDTIRRHARMSKRQVRWSLIIAGIILVLLGAVMIVTDNMATAPLEAYESADLMKEAAGAEYIDIVNKSTNIELQPSESGDPVMLNGRRLILLRRSGVEADDYWFTVIKTANENLVKKYISTDLIQLEAEEDYALYVFKGQPEEINACREKWPEGLGYTPEFVAYNSLNGDYFAGEGSADGMNDSNEYTALLHRMLSRFTFLQYTIRFGSSQLSLFRGTDMDLKEADDHLSRLQIIRIIFIILLIAALGTLAYTLKAKKILTMERVKQRLIRIVILGVTGALTAVIIFLTVRITAQNDALIRINPKLYPYTVVDTENDMNIDNDFSRLTSFYIPAETGDAEAPDVAPADLANLKSFIDEAESKRAGNDASAVSDSGAAETAAKAVSRLSGRTISFYYHTSDTANIWDPMFKKDGSLNKYPHRISVREGKQDVAVFSKIITYMHATAQDAAIPGSNFIWRVLYYAALALIVALFVGLLYYFRYERDLGFPIINTVLLIVIMIVTLYPVLNTVAYSFSSGNAASRGKIGLIPQEFTTKSYRDIMDNYMLGAAWISVAKTVLTTLLNLFWTGMLAFTLTRKEYALARPITLIMVVTMYVNAGLIPNFLLISQTLGLKNTFWVYIIPTMFSRFNMIIIRTYIASLPGELVESARIDGAGDIRIYWQIIFPLCAPVLATVALFIAVGSWNSWFDTMLYNATNKHLHTLQYVLMGKVANAGQTASLAQNSSSAAADLAKTTVNTRTVQCATTVVTALPILVVYPFLQKYFVTGMALGSVKG